MYDNKTDPDTERKVGESFDAGDRMSALISAILTLINICLLVTCVPGRCRAISVTWYIYILIAAIVLYGIVICVGLATPVLTISTGCVIVHSFSRWLQLLYSSYVLWINQEVLVTVICPKLSWATTKLRRLYRLTCVTIVISLIVVIVHGALTYQDGCWNESLFGELAIYILKDCIIGISVIVFGIINTVCYVRLRTRGLETYNHAVEGSPVKLHPTEWFVYVTLINIIFVIFGVMFAHVSMVVDFSDISVRFLEWESLLLLGLPILALSTVRSTIGTFFRRIVCRQGGVDTEEAQDMEKKGVESGDKMLPLAASE